MKLRLVVNPRAAGGRAADAIPLVVRRFAHEGERCEVAQTTGPGDAERLARQAIADGVDVLAVMGGDGTFNELSQAFVDRHGNPVDGPEVGLLPCGTGGDFRRSVDLGHDLDASVRQVLRGRVKHIDLAQATLWREGHAVTRCFINVGSFGISGLICANVNAAGKRLGGTMTFYMATVRAALTYRNVPVRVSVDGRPVYEGPVFACAFANGNYFGGGMKIAPAAKLDDGLLDAVILGDFTRLGAYSLTAHIYRGTHLNNKHVESYRGQQFEALPLTSPAPPIELDGETPGTLPLQVRVVPGALALRCPA